MIDLERVRADTPGVETVAHFNNAGAALMLRPVLDAVIGHLELGVAERYERVQSLATALRAGLEASWPGSSPRPPACQRESGLRRARTLPASPSPTRASSAAAS